MSITIEQRRQHRLTTIENSLARRHRQEKRFRFAGLAAVVIGLTLVTILFISIFDARCAGILAVNSVSRNLLRS